MIINSNKMHAVKVVGIVLFFTFHFSFLTISAQGTLDDYRRANSLRTTYSGKTKNSGVRVHLVPSTHRFWYSVWNGNKEVYKEVDADKRTVTLLPENPELPQPPRPSDGKPERHWMEVPDEKDGVQRTPDGKDSIYHKDNNLWFSGRVLTTNGTPDNYYSSWGSFSPDGRYYATVRIKPAPKHYVYYIESSPKGRTEPILHKQEYAKPGDSLNYRVPVIIEVATGRVVEPATTLFAHQYEVTMPRWDKNGQTITFEFNERGHKTYRVLEMDLQANVRILIEETDPRYVNYTRQRRIDLEDSRHILWTSERDNYNHIYLYDRGRESQESRLVRQITKGEWNVREIQHVDEKQGVIYFSACGMNKQEDPYLIHYYKIRIDGKQLTCLTPEEGHHSATFTDDFTYLIDTYSTVTNPPVSVLRSAKDGRILKTLETADITDLLASGWRAPEVFVAPGRDGITPMWGIILRPSNFDPTKKYPIIEYIYSGPGDQYVPKSWREWYWGMAELAELGFIVVQLDAMTTSWRSKDFEAVCYKNLKDAGFPDRKAWIKAATQKYSYIDADRVGIYGCSAGGQNALAAVLFHGDFYKAAYAACGCHDNRMDKIWWNEQWMSYPVDSSYVACSNVENAWRLERPLMLVVGEMDDNVDPASTMQVVNALEKAGKDFELVVIPGARHTMGEAFGDHKRQDFFVRHLLGVNPPQWKDLR
jgi:dipeptidyl aminopeptidase/acylaminoacyl peptidase